MLEHAAVTAADRPQNTDPGDYVVWQHRFRPFRIRLKPGIDSALQANALAAVRSGNSYEIGGLLFGRIETHGPDVCVTITNAAFVRSKHRIFNSTTNDRAALVDALQNNRDPESKPIGYFRSDLRDQFALTAEDRQFVISSLPIPHSVSLLIRPLQTGACMLGVFLWKNNRIQDEFADFEMPLFGSEAQNSSEPLTTALPAASPAAAASTPPEAVSVSLRRDHVPMTTGEGRGTASGLLLALVAATVCLLAVIAGLLFSIARRSPGQPGVQPTAPATTLVVQSVHKQDDGAGVLGLQVSRPAPDQLNVTWSRKLPSDAKRGVLDIVDGSKHRSLTLDEGQLQLGRLTYFSTGADISFRLEVISSKGSPVGEYIRVLGTETYPNSFKMPGQAKEIPTEQARLSGDVRPIAAVKALPVSRESDHFVPAAIAEAAPTVPSLQPELATALPVPQPPPAIAAQAPSESQRTPLPTPSGSAAPKSDASINPPSSGSGLKPPQPLQRVMPKIHDIFPNGLPTASRIPVDVIVNAAGKVVKASTTERFGLLSDACVTAAKQWRFVPASQNKQPVASQYQIVFVFDARK